MNGDIVNHLQKGYIQVMLQTKRSSIMVRAISRVIIRVRVSVRVSMARVGYVMSMGFISSGEEIKTR